MHDILPVSQESKRALDLLRVLTKHRLLICVLTALSAVAAIFYAVTATPMFKSTARLIIENEKPSALSIQDVLPANSLISDYYQTQYRVIKSATVLEEAAARLGLEEKPEFAPAQPLFARLGLASLWNQGRSSLSFLFGPVPTPEPIENQDRIKRQIQLETFASRIEVVPIRSSRLVDISFESADSAFAAEAANAVSQTYMDHNMLDRLNASQEAVRWLHKSLLEERSRVEAAELKLQNYKEQHSILTDFSTGNESITAQRLSELNSQVIQAESRRMEAQTRYNQMSKAQDGPLDAISEALTNTHLAAIKTAEVENQKKLAELSRKYIGGHPDLAAAKVESRSLQESRNNELHKILRSLRNEYEAAMARETSLKASLAKFKQESQNLNKNATEYYAFKREAESAKQMYDLLLKRLNETVVAEDLKATNIRVIDKAVPSAIPSKPQKARLVLLAILGGLVGGIALAFLLEQLDNTISSIEDVERIMEVPFLSAVPAFRMSGSSMAEVITLRSPRSPASEAFRSLRTSIQFSTAGLPPEVLLVTGSTPADGKTVTAVNLAASLAQAGSSVLLIDCDLRRPRVHKTLGVPREPGLTNILAGGASPESVICRDKILNLDVITSGVAPPNPAELVGSKRMAEFLTEMRKRYDRVILDSPPLPAFTDAAILSSLTDGVVLVVRAGVTHKTHARLTVRHLRGVKARILGTVLNAVKPSHDDYYYRHSYYYARENT